MNESNARSLLETARKQIQSEQLKELPDAVRDLAIEFEGGMDCEWLASILAAYEAGRLAVLEQMKTKDVQYKPFQGCDWLVEGAYDQDGNSPRFYADDAELLAYLDAQEQQCQP